MTLDEWFSINGDTDNVAKIVVGHYRFVDYKIVAFLMITHQGQDFDPANHILNIDNWVDKALITDWVPVAEGETLGLAVEALMEKLKAIHYSPAWFSEVQDLFDSILTYDENVNCYYDKPIPKKFVTPL